MSDQADKMPTAKAKTSNEIPDPELIRNNPKMVKRAVYLAGILGGLQSADPIVAFLALPEVGKSLQMTTTTLVLASSISTLFSAATVVVIGALADRTGRRLMMVIATIGLIVGDLIAAVAPTSSIFMLGRAIAGICVGGVLATAYAYVRTVSPPEKLGANLGLWAALSAALTLPTVIIASGFASLNWRLAFLCIPIIAAICLPLQLKIFPKVAPATVRKQLYGVSLAGLGVVGILWGISQTATQILAPASIIPILGGLVLVAVAAVVGLRSSRPAYPVRLFRSPVFITAALAGGLWNMSLAVGHLQSSNLWQYVHGVTPFAASLRQVPMVIALIGGSLLIGRLLAKGLKPREIISGGFVIVAVGFAIMMVTGTAALGIAFNLGLVLLGFGAGAAAVAQSQILIVAAPAEFAGSVSASRTSFGQIGYAIGLAGSGVITSLLTISKLGSATGREQFNAFFLEPENSTVAPVYEQGFASGMIVWAVIFVIGAVVCYILMSTRNRPLVASADVASTP